MANSFTSVFYIEAGGAFSSGNFGPTEIFTVPNTHKNFGPTLVASIEVSAPNVFGTTDVFTMPNFIAGLFVMGNVIQSTENSNLDVTNLTVADRSGSGNATWSTPAGASTQLNGFRFNTENRTSSFEMTLEKSGRVWTNTGAGEITASLPSGAPQGWFAWIKRTGTGGITIQPGANDKLLYGTNEIVKSDGAAGRLASSGSYAVIFADVSSDWVLAMSGGMIS